jgi:bifunctional DNA-binding transcriptional regulator/antitoxin component of YhaV-PrlF toxin-antitoxin module
MFVKINKDGVMKIPNKIIKKLKWKVGDKITFSMGEDEDGTKVVIMEKEE